MSQFARIQNSYIHIPTDPKKADEFIGRWRACQDLALKDVQRNNLTMEECLNVAYEDIKNRKGKILDGVFVK